MKILEVFFVVLGYYLLYEFYYLKNCCIEMNFNNQLIDLKVIKIDFNKNESILILMGILFLVKYFLFTKQKTSLLFRKFNYFKN